MMEFINLENCRETIMVTEEFTQCSYFAIQKEV